MHIDIASMLCVFGEFALTEEGVQVFAEEVYAVRF
jgi:hypothetical protein